LASTILRNSVAASIEIVPEAIIASSENVRLGRTRFGGHLTACHYVVVDHARIRHAGNLTPEPASHEPLIRIRVED
jgi:hypothetical protein